MGGNVFTTPDFKSRRVELKEFLRIKEDMINIFNDSGIFLRFGEYVRDKTSFGDLDIIVPNDDTEACLELLKRYQYQHSRNSNVISFLYHDFQIDLITVNHMTLNYSVDYYSWNDIHNLIGKLAKKVGFKHGQNGLEYVIRDHTLNSDNRIMDTIFLSSDPDVILNILGLSVQRYKDGFDTVTDMFEYVSTSPYFSPKFYELTELAAKDRTRDKKRINFQLFLKWCEENTFDLESKIIVQKEDRYLLPYQWFPWLEDEVKKVYAAKAKHDLIKSKFNGSIVMSLIPELSGKELGKFIQAFKDQYANFDSVILETNQKDINRAIKLYWSVKWV
jgi:hypothetical protein